VHRSQKLLYDLLEEFPAAQSRLSNSVLRANGLRVTAQAT